MARAASTSTATMRACACGERWKATIVWPG